MKQPHFFIIQSRLGLKHPPHGSTELNIGVEDGGNQILSPDFTFEFDHLDITRLVLPKPEEFIDDQAYVQLTIEEYSSIATFIPRQLKKNEIQVSLGGDHSIGFPSMLADMKRFGTAKIGMIMFDSHGDLHTLATSPSGNLHGMWVRMLFPNFDHELVQKTITEPLHPEQLLYIGNLVVEKEEQQFLEENNIHCIDSKKIDTNEAKATITQFIQQFDHIHLSFDIDVFRKNLAPATGTPNPEGLTKEQVFPLLEIFDNAKSLSIDLVEVNPRKTGSEQTLELARDVLRVLLKNELNYPLQPVI